MDSLRPVHERIRDLEPYDPKYLPARTTLSANENPLNLPDAVRERIGERVAALDFNRYPDPLANDLRDMIAAREGLKRSQVLVGNGGDELLFDTFLAWGGPGRTFLNFPPTFSVYATNATLTGTREIDVDRDERYDIDRERALEAIEREKPDIIVLTSPNNPTGNVIEQAFLEDILDASDALVLLDEAYIEFAERSLTGLIDSHANLAVLRTFSKAYACAGVRIGYLLSDESVIREFLKVRQPYSVDRIAQIIGEEAYRASDIMTDRVRAVREERARLFHELSEIPGVQVMPSEANYLLVHVADAHRVCENLYGKHSVLVRDFSSTPGLEDCLRITVGTREEDDELLASLRDELDGKETR